MFGASVWALYQPYARLVVCRRERLTRHYARSPTATGGC